MCSGESAVDVLIRLFITILENEGMPNKCRKCVLVPIFKNKGGLQSCGNYRGLKLISHAVKVWERVVEARLRQEVKISEQQFGFMPRKRTTGAISALGV